MDFPTFRIIDVPSDSQGKSHVIKKFDRKLVLVHDSTFGQDYKEGIIFTSGDSDHTYILFDPISEKKTVLEYENLRGLMVRVQNENKS